MSPQPCYAADSLTPCYRLRYGWTGWPADGTEFPPKMESRLRDAADAWESDNLRILEGTFSARRVMLTFSVTPCVSPVFFTARVKGRLQHALSGAGIAVAFSRKVAVVTIGHNHRAEVEAYIEQQPQREQWADQRAAALFESLVYVNPAVDLSQPSTTNSGRYWYNLHIVLTTMERWRGAGRKTLTTIRDQALRIAEKKGYLISRLSPMPDHLHISLRGAVDQSPEQIALAFMNNLAWKLGNVRVWQAGYYTGTFGDYDMNAVR